MTVIERMREEAETRSEILNEIEGLIDTYSQDEVLKIMREVLGEYQAAADEEG